MKGVIYARYSSDNQREESIEGQLRECKDYAERNGITILGTYIDRALSAKTDNRPEFQKMIKDSAKGLFDVVLVWKLDRFARNRYDSARYKNLLKKNGVKVISARENISEGSEGIILEAMLEGYAEYYSAELSEKVIRGLTDNALKCKYNGGTVPMGYYIDEQQFYQIDPKTAPVVLEMFTKYSEGATMQELVNLLNSRGMRSIRGGKITLNIMNHLLKNRRYMGEYSYRDVVKEDGIPAIVPKELFERVQERLAKNKKAPARHKAEDDYLLTTKLYCGKCGSFMVGESGTSHTMKVHRYYRCVNTKKKKLCDKKAVKKDWIEDLVVNYTMKAIMNDEVMERLIDTLMELQKKESTDLPLLKKQLAETEKGINNMLNAIQAGIFTPSTKQRLDELEETKSQLEVSILQEEMHKPLLTREQIAFFIYRFRKFDVTKREQRQRLIDSFVNAVYLYEDKIILTFNYKDGSKTITLADVEGSDLSSFGAPNPRELRLPGIFLSAAKSAGLPRETGAGFLRAEAREHDDKIRDIQSADEKADPALEPALRQRRDERARAHDEARRDVQQHALPLNRQGLAKNERAQRHNERQVHDVRADDVAHRQGRLLFADGRDGRNKLRQRSADGDHGSADDGVRHADHLRECGAVVDQQLRAKHDGRGAEHEFADVERDRPAVRLRTLVGLRPFERLLTPRSDKALGNKAHKNDKDQNALKDGQLPVAREAKQNRDRRQQQHRLDGILPTRHGALHTDQRQAHDEARIGRDGADGIAHGDVRVALEGRKHGHEHLRHGRGKAHDRCADDEFWDAGGLRDPRGSVNKNVAALDDAHKARRKQQQDKKEGTAGKIEVHNAFSFVIAQKKRPLARS